MSALSAFMCSKCGRRFPHKQNCVYHLKRKHKIICETIDQYVSAGLVVFQGNPQAGHPAPTGHPSPSDSFSDSTTITKFCLEKLESSGFDKFDDEWLIPIERAWQIWQAQESKKLDDENLWFICGHQILLANQNQIYVYFCVISS